jgi:hypothetical protein
MKDLLEAPNAIADDGFTARVMARVPQRRELRTPIVLGSLAAACAATYGATGALAALLPAALAMAMLVAMIAVTAED